MSMRMIAALALLALIGVEAQTDWRSLRNGAPIQCGICGGGRDSAGNPVAQSKDVDFPDNTYTSSTGRKWTCDYLQQTNQDVNPAGADTEGISCGNARCGQAHKCCAQRNSLCTDFTDINKRCDMCAGRGLDSSKSGVTVRTTEMGNLNCGGLAMYAESGGISSSVCPRLQSQAASCCLAGGNNGGGNTASTKQPTKRPTNQATQPTKFPTKFPTRKPFAPTPKANRQKDNRISGGSGGAAGRKRALDESDVDSTTSGSVGISSGLMGILVALVGLCIAR